jgi:hypothetical protein
LEPYFYLVLFANIRDDANRMSAQGPDLFGYVLTTFLIPIDDRNVCALASEQQCDLPPDSLSGSGHDTYLSGELGHRLSPMLFTQV